MPGIKNSKFVHFLNNLPDILKGREIKEIIKRTVKAYKAKRFILTGIGAHVIKCGLQPWIISLMKRGVIKGLAMNGACIIHDFEITRFGETSENVDDLLDKGQFGFSKETAEFLNDAIKEAKVGEGIGYSLGKKMCKEKLRFSRYSLLSNAYKLGIPVSVHVAIGTDIIHMHKSTDGAKIGLGTYEDFKCFCGMVEEVLKGGVYFNFGSAVILPEIFLKAVSQANNKGVKKGDFTTVNLDMLPQYRPITNVVKRPTAKKGRGYNLIGHHELIIPMLFQGIIENI